MDDKTEAVLQEELAGFDEIIAIIKETAVSQSKDEKNNSPSLLDVASAFVEKDSVCSNTGLGRALRELSSLDPPPNDPSTWLGFRLRDYRPAQGIVEYGENVLDGLVMKCDEFANIHKLSTKRLHPKSWNFRKCDEDELPIFGVGQCHIEGIQFLLERLNGEGFDFDTIKWFNMREEPVVFLDGQACAPRTEGNMNENVEYLMGIEGHELDSMELRLCSDCIEVAAKTADNTIGVFYQTKDGGNEERRLTASRESEKTFSIRKGYEWLSKQNPGVQVEYSRIPIADETAPEEKDFDQLIAELRGCISQPKTAFVFNCQMGRGRTTTGMVSACIMAKALQQQQNKSDVSSVVENKPSALKIHKSMQLLTAITEKKGKKENNRKRGEFVSILSLMDLISCACKTTSGKEAKELADTCIDACAHAQNMVEAIEACEGEAATAEIGAARSPEFWKRRAHNYLERYAYIVLFAAYALENAATNYTAMNFSEWSHQYWQFKRSIKHLTLD